ncbi:MAG: winged helix DNA-binding domain-containing protein, partial [Actinomycetota bacterium]
VQTQYAPSGYIGLWSRLAGFERHHLTRALERRVVVQGTLMRSTIHMVTARDYPLLAAGTRRDRRAWVRGATRGQIPEPRMETIAHEVRGLLADGPRRRADLVAALEVAPTVWNGVGAWIDLLRVPPSGTWEQRRGDLYAAADDWLGRSTATVDTGVELLVRRYLGGFGPAPRKDIAGWAGLSMSTLAPVLDRMTLRRFRDERGADLFDLPRAPLPPADAHAPVRLLPTWDATLLVHQRRTQILPEQHRSLVFSARTPHSSPTLLVDGQVAGLWTFERGRVRADLFGPLPRTARRELDEEIRRFEGWLAR